MFAANKRPSRLAGTVRPPPAQAHLCPAASGNVRQRPAPRMQLSGSVAEDARLCANHVRQRPAEQGVHLTH
jgi:hypothetical protein